MTIAKSHFADTGGVWFSNTPYAPISLSPSVFSFRAGLGGI